MEDFIKSIKPDTSLYDNFVCRVMKECNVSRQTWNNWIHGKPIAAKNKRIINNIATELYGQTVFSEK